MHMHVFCTKEKGVTEGGGSKRWMEGVSVFIKRLISFTLATS